MARRWRPHAAAARGGRNISEIVRRRDGVQCALPVRHGAWQPQVFDSVDGDCGKDSICEQYNNTLEFTRDQGRRIVRAVDQGLELVSEVAGAAEELKNAVKKTETPTIDPTVYN